MNRKTNVFYLTGNDSRFLTFDNYTDALTGDIIATNKKLWPSRFLCINIENLDKDIFIKEYLVKYYENKLAFLRDNLDENSESNLVPLTYLLEAICLYGANEIKHKNFETIENLETDLYNNYRTYNDEKSLNLMNYIKTNYGVDFCYIGDIVEQDYNGTYADIICTISPNNRKLPLFKINNDYENGIITENINDETEEYEGITVDYIKKEYVSDNNTLFGWNSSQDKSFIKQYFYPNDDPNVFVDLNFKFDTKWEENGNEIKKGYLVNSIIKDLSVTDNSSALSFNIIIPLFDMCDITEIDINDIEDETVNETTNETVSIINIAKNKSVPLGIYFCDKTIELDNDINGYSSNWSLLISTQFKPFPYSYNITHNFDDSDNIKDAYLTFAEILGKQTNFIDLLNKYNDTVVSISNRVSILESIINSISSVQNIDEISQNFINLKTTVNNQIKNLQDQIDILSSSVEANKLKWHIKNNE